MSGNKRMFQQKIKEISADSCCGVIGVSVRRYRVVKGEELSWEDFGQLADAACAELPAALFRELNGGIVVEEEAKEEEGELVLGEYIEDFTLGRLIVLYYGSFKRLYRRAPRRVWAKEIAKTIRHELRHHIESLAGVDDLAREEMAFRTGRRGY